MQVYPLFDQPLHNNILLSRHILSFKKKLSICWNNEAQDFSKCVTYPHFITSVNLE